ncbi:hypothetical protein EYF80_008219 [Liparis tanakae]|uniref:Uncharacterized protein n=1 Tax=Liparis tanakae TaxID=230148 RepID=A0A4Z2IUM6_9TELE|nr:hypothetical protein EYF80_008219 [Liparis tanakae]
MDRSSHGGCCYTPLHLPISTQSSRIHQLISTTSSGLRGVIDLDADRGSRPSGVPYSSSLLRPAKLHLPVGHQRASLSNNPERSAESLYKHSLSPSSQPLCVPTLLTSTFSISSPSRPHLFPPSPPHRGVFKVAAENVRYCLALGNKHHQLLQTNNIAKPSTSKEEEKMKTSSGVFISLVDDILATDPHYNSESRLGYFHIWRALTGQFACQFFASGGAAVTEGGFQGALKPLLQGDL